MRRLSARTQSTGTATPLGVPGFRTLAAAYSINELGNWLGDIALAVLVYDHTKSALATALLFIGTRFVPAFAAPPLVARTQRFRARAALPLLYGLEAIVFGLLAVLAANGFSLGLIVVLGAIDGTLALPARVVTRSTSAAVLS